VPHAVAALLQLYIPAVVLELIIDRLRSVGVGSIDDSMGEPPQLGCPQDRCMVGEQLLGLINILRT
jgi:hypothetical protein